jgi:acetyl esterase
MNRFLSFTTILAGALAFALSGCSNNASNSQSSNTDSTKTDTIASMKPVAIKPTGPKPAWGQDLHPEMQAVLEKLASYNDPAIPTLTAVQARMNHTPADAVMALVAQNNITVPAPTVDTIGKEIPVEGGMIHIRIYTPKNAASLLPVMVYYHGGGWVIADINTYNSSAQGLAEQANAIVIAVEYRKAPEHRFPTAVNDAFAAYKWVLKNADSLKGDGKKVAVVGESAGGNLAVNVSIMARDRGIQLPIYQVLVYPIASNNTNSASYMKNDSTRPLNKGMMQWFFNLYAPSASTLADPRINPVKANLKGLPPTTIITAEIDPLHDDGQVLSDELKKAGVTVNYKNYDGVTHEFFGMAIIVPEAKDAEALAASDLKNAFSK